MNKSKMTLILNVQFYERIGWGVFLFFSVLLMLYQRIKFEKITRTEIDDLNSIQYSEILQKIKPRDSAIQSEKFENHDFKKSPDSKEFSTRRNISELEKVDINSANYEELLAVRGIGEKFAHRILEYRETIGSFKDLEELKSLKGFKYNWDELKPYLKVVQRKDTALFLTGVPKRNEVIDLNSITVSEFKALKLLPDENADQIFKYRDACKGFKNIDHALRTYGLTDRMKEILKKKCKVKTSPSLPAFYININTASAEDLEKLPAIGVKLSTRIVKYRKLIWFYKDIDQLKEVYYLTDSTFQIIKKYVFVDKKQNKKNRKNIKTISSDSLIKHPYFRKNGLAYRIKEYSRDLIKNEHLNDDETQLSERFGPEELEKIHTYLKIE